jgi:hypothetical protein
VPSHTWFSNSKREGDLVAADGWPEVCVDAVLDGDDIDDLLDDSLRSLPFLAARTTSTRKTGMAWAMMVTDGSRKLKMDT